MWRIVINNIFAIISEFHLFIIILSQRVILINYILFFKQRISTNESSHIDYKYDICKHLIDLFLIFS